MAEYAKLFRNGGSQAVRLPREHRFPGDPSPANETREGSDTSAPGTRLVGTSVRSGASCTRRHPWG